MALKILILDISIRDIENIKSEIENYFSDVVFETADNRKDFILKLSKFKPDAVISTNLPSLDVLTALHITQEMYPNLPFVILTEHLEDEDGILCIKKGADDYISKQNLKKVPLAIKEAISRYNLINENRKIFENLKESERKFRLLAENAQDVIYRYELYPNRGFTFVSPSATKIVGYTPDEHYSDPDLGFKIVHPDDRHILEKIAKGEIKVDEPVCLRWIKKDGTILWTEQRNNPIYDEKGNLIAIEGIARDITESKRLEEELKESEIKFKMITSLSTDYAYSFIVDENGNMEGEWVSDTFIKVFGWTLPELKACGGWQAAFYSEDLPKWIEHSKKVLSGASDTLEGRMITKFGDIRWVVDYAVPVFDDKGRVKKIYGAAKDLTESKILQEELRQREEHFERLAESTTTAIFVYQGEHFVYLNKAAEIISGYSKDELLKMKFYEIIHPDYRELVKERGLKRQAGESVPTNYEFKIITKNGEEKWVDFTGSLINWFGKPAGIGTAYDITPLKTAIQNLEKATQKWLAIFNNTPLGILIEDANGTIVDGNAMIEKTTGFSIKELVGKPVHILAADENKDIVDQNIQKILSGEILNHIVKSKHKNGSEIYCHLVETKIILPDGSPGILSTSEDITEKVLLQNRLLENERKFRTIFETAIEGICIVDKNENITDVNPKFSELVGYSKEELIGKNFEQLLVHPDEIEDAISRKVKRINKKSQIFQRRLVRKDKTIIIVKVSATGIYDDKDEYIGSFAFFSDITEQKKLEAELKQSEEQFRLIWENSQDGMRLTDENGIVVLVNPAFCKMVGLPKEKIEGNYLSMIYSPDRRDEILSKHQRRFRSGKIKSQFETLVTLHDNRKLWFEVSNSFIKISGKKLLLGVFRDITERKRLEAELIKSEAQFRTILQNSSDAMILIDTLGVIRLVNRSLCDLVDLPSEKLIGQPLSVVFHTTSREKLFKMPVEKFFDDEIQPNFEGEVFLHNGKRIWIEARFSTLKTNDEKLHFAIIRDITERKKLIDDLIRAKEEAEEANRLKSGFISMMSHEIRTPLNVILGFTSVLKEVFTDKREDEEIPKYFDAIEKSGKRLLNTINHILDISRIEAGEYEVYMKPIKINDEVMDIIDQMQVLADQRKISFHIELDPSDPVLVLDKYCLDSILINLINNSIKYSYENSKIEISTKVKEEGVTFRVRDYGIGMSEEYQKHLFVPFSQEEVGYGRPYEGTGLGLALTKKFVELMKGEIKVWSKKGEGTEFKVFFPQSNNNA